MIKTDGSITTTSEDGTVIDASNSAIKTLLDARNNDPTFTQEMFVQGIQAFAHSHAEDNKDEKQAVKDEVIISIQASVEELVKQYNEANPDSQISADDVYHYLATSDHHLESNLTAEFAENLKTLDAALDATEAALNVNIPQGQLKKDQALQGGPK